MRAIHVTRNGGPDVLEVAELPVPEAGDGQVVVQLSYAGVNFADVYQRIGGGRFAPPPFVPGTDGSGVVSEVGAGVTDLAVGDRVVVCISPGCYAESVAASADRVVKLPDGISEEVAASVFSKGLTAHYLATETYPVQEGDVVLVHAAAGGVGRLLTQMAKLRGARVIATTSTPEKAEVARAAGADDVLSYDEFPQRVLELTDGAGVAAVYDSVAKDTFDGSLESLRMRGILVLFGAASGQVPPFDPMRLAPKSAYLTRPGLPGYVATREVLVRRASELFGWVAGGTVTAHTGGTYPLERARDAHADLESRRTVGELVLKTR